MTKTSTCGYFNAHSCKEKMVCWFLWRSTFDLRYHLSKIQILRLLLSLLVKLTLSTQSKCSVLFML